MIGQVFYFPHEDGWLCGLTAHEPDDHVAHDVGKGYGKTKEEARAAALTFAERLFQDAKTRATSVEVSYKRHREDNGEWGLWHCIILGDYTVIESDIAIGHCVGYGFGITFPEAYIAAMLFAEQALAAVKALP